MLISLEQSILTHSLEDASFGLGWTKYVNAVLHYTYLGLLIMCFLLSMGNKPQGSKKSYLFAMVMFAIITAYMIVSFAKAPAFVLWQKLNQIINSPVVRCFLHYRQRYYQC